MTVMLEQRVTNLEELMRQLIQTVSQTSREMRDFKDEMRDFKDEMLVFKDEMRDFKDEMLVFKDEMRDFKDEMLVFKDEMLVFKDEMLVFKDEMRDFKNEMLVFKNEMSDFKDEMHSFKDEMGDFKDDMRRKWGELSNKMGTMAEDLVAPSIPRILRAVIDCPTEVIDSAVRVKRHHQTSGKQQEFDVVASCGEYLLINETKSKLKPEDVKAFAGEILPAARDFFPEHSDKKIIGAIASLYVDESLVRYGEKQGVVVLGFGEDVMDVLNSPEFVPKTW